LFYTWLFRLGAEIPVLWVDHGYNRPATYRHAEELKRLLKINLKAYLPLVTAAHRDAIYGAVPRPTDEKGLKQFSALMKLEPFQRGMRELAPSVGSPRCGKSKTESGELDIVSQDSNFKTLKISPVFYLTDVDMEEYLKKHQLPNEWIILIPPKPTTNGSAGLHAEWGAKAIASRESFTGANI